MIRTGLTCQTRNAIDVHAHVVLEWVLACAGHYGPELGIGPEGRSRLRVGRDRLVIGTNLAGWDAPTEPEHIPFVADYDLNARRLLRL